MSDRDHPITDDTVRCGLLMESAQAQQRMAETLLAKLLAHTEGLDEVVREEIRRTLLEEFRALRAEGDRASRSLLAHRRLAGMRGVAWNAGFALLWVVVPAAIAHYAWPSTTEVAALRVARDTMAENLRDLRRQGGNVDWRHCGPERRLCVRVDRKAPVFGARGEYAVADGY